VSYTWLPRPSDPVRSLSVFLYATMANQVLAAVETVLPATWIACAALGYAAWNRMSECTGGDNVEKLLVV